MPIKISPEKAKRRDEAKQARQLAFDALYFAAIKTLQPDQVTAWVDLILRARSSLDLDKMREILELYSGTKLK